MTMFSQKLPFDLTEFLSKPASSGSRSSMRSKRPRPVDDSADVPDAPVIEAE